jgi:hypothetical protein
MVCFLEDDLAITPLECFAKLLASVECWLWVVVDINIVINTVNNINADAILIFMIFACVGLCKR